MRILFLSHRYTDTTIGGLAEFLHYLPLALSAFGIESVLYTKAQKNEGNQLILPEPLLKKVPHYSGPFLKPRLMISKKALSPLLQLCEKEKIDLLHAQGTYRAGFMALSLYKKTGIPYIVTSHSDILETNSQRIHRPNIRRRCVKVLKQAAGVTHLTPLMASASHNIHPTPHKSVIIHNGVDCAAWEAFSTPREQDYLLAIGRLESEKGFPLLIEAYAALKKRGVTSSLVIAGTGSIEHQLQTQARHHGLPVITGFKDFDHVPAGKVLFTGYVRAAEKKTLFSQAKLVLFATQPQAFEEAFGIVQLEAMAAGKTLIASHMPTTHYLQSLGLQAKLVPPENIYEWQEAIVSLLKDDNQRLTMGKMNRAIVQQFDWALIAKAYAEIYRQVRRD